MEKRKGTDGPPPLPWEEHGWISPEEGLAYLARDKDPLVLLSSSASAQDLRSLHVEKETRVAVEEASPRGVLEDGLRCLDSETSSSKASTSYAGPQANQSSSSQWRGFLRLWRQRSMRRLSTFPPIGAPKLLRRRSNKEDHVHRQNPASDADCSFFKPSWKSFSICELQKATNNFNPENVIGKGGYAEVYKGCLEDGQLVAIKRLTRGTAEEQISNFLSELGIIVHINHPNAAKLIGFGVEGGMHLVLQLSQNGCLASLLHASGKKMEWGIRRKVAIGTAEGLEYLHEKCRRRIIHRDIKAANILLAEDFEPQICDFGLAKWLPDQWTHHSMSSFEGTFGYLAPEYFMHGIVDEKTDVFAFGVLLLELITGREAVDSSQHSLVTWVMPLLEKNDIIGLIDPSLGDAYDYAQLKYAALTASLCIQQSSILRPRMSQVVKLLKGDDSVGKLPQRPLLRRTFSEEIFDAEEYNATRYLNDLNQYKQQALRF